MRNQRKKIWIDRFQTVLSLRILLYFFLYQMAVWSLVAVERTAFDAFSVILGPAGAGYCILFALITVLFIGFLFTWDAVCFSHRIVGPLYRFRKTMQAVAAGEKVELIRLRQGDFLLELRDEFNEMLKTLEARGAITLKGAADAAPAPAPPEGAVSARPLPQNV